MANLNQFYKGEAITVTVKDDDGNALVGQYDSSGNEGNYDGEIYKYASIRAYPDDLNLENGDTAKIKQFLPSEDGTVFSIDGETSKEMVDGQYTIELIYGKDDTERVIVKSVHAFTIAGSAYKRELSNN